MKSERHFVCRFEMFLNRGYYENRCSTSTSASTTTSTSYHARKVTFPCKLRNIQWIAFSLLFALCLPVSDLIHYYYCHHAILIFPFQTTFLLTYANKIQSSKSKSKSTSKSKSFGLPFRKSSQESYKYFLHQHF